MKTILALTDFSPAALNSAFYAADLAVACDVDLLLLHIYQMPLLLPEVPLQVTIKQIETDARKGLDEISNMVSQRTGNRLKIRTAVTVGSFFDELKFLCETLRPYYVVMGSHGASAAERMVFGSHAVKVSKHLAWPVITVPPGTSFSSSKKIALACDLNDLLASVPFGEIKKLVKDFNAILYVINLGKQTSFDPEIVYGARLLEEKLAPVKPHYEFLSGRDTDKGILDFINRNTIDLLIVLPKQHGLLTGIIYKRHTKQLVLHCPVPVVALHQ